MINRAAQLWSLLDDMSESDPEGYQHFIRRQLRDGADFYSMPKPQYCLRTRMRDPEDSILYINMCSWKRVPYPESPSHAVPIYGGRLETVSDSQETYQVLDVAFNPKVLCEEQEDCLNKQLPLLAINFAQQQHGLHLSQSYTLTSTCPKGNFKDLHQRLLGPRHTKDPGPSLLQHISPLRKGPERRTCSPISLHPSGETVPPLIQVISCTDTLQPQSPKHELSFCEGQPGKVQLTVDLPGVCLVSECQLSVSQDDVLLKVGDLYRLHLVLPVLVREEEAKAVFKKRKQKLFVSLPVR